MKKIIKISCLLFSMALFSCSDNDIEGLTSLKVQAEEQKAPFTKMSKEQATLYASLFSNIDDGEEVNAQQTRSTETERVVSDIQYYVQDGDTVIYVFNYGQNQGYLMLGADNSSYPILAQSKEGRLDLNNINNNSFLKVFIESNAQRIKEEIYKPENVNTEYYEDWADLGKEGYEYIIEVADDEPSAPVTRGSGRRKTSSGKASIYPYTGKDLDFWCQKGGYNMSAPNLACIGCPAIAIGMLLYDTSERQNGNVSSTVPSFSYMDKSDIQSLTVESSLSQRLREIANKIPNYNWGKTKNAESGASPADIQTGLRSIGFTNATLTDYNFETLYTNLKFKGVNYFGNEQEYTRGILLGAFHTDANGGHIWFCDGYYEQSFKVTKKFIGIKVKSWTEYDDRLYMNWGWGKDNGNGWYAANESVWTTLEGNKQPVYYKRLPKMYINVSTYVRPN